MSLFEFSLQPSFNVAVLCPLSSLCLYLFSLCSLTLILLRHEVFTSRDLPHPTLLSLLLSRCRSLFLYFFLTIYYHDQTLTTYQKLCLRPMSPSRRSALDGSPQDPHSHPTPPQPGMEATAPPSPSLEEPTIGEMPSITKMVRPADQYHSSSRHHTSSPTLPFPASYTGNLLKHTT